MKNRSLTILFSVDAHAVYSGEDLLAQYLQLKLERLGKMRM